MPVEPGKYDFDYFLEKIGNGGRYQKTFNILFNCLYPALVTAIYFSINISLAVPDHWCKVPGRPTNVSLEKWKELTIPWISNSLGNEEYSKCEMFSPSGHTVGCQYGWEYDTTWFKNTLTSQHNWVCDKSSYVNDAFTFLTIGDVLGSFVFGQLGDMYGRRPIFLVSTLSILIGRIWDLYTSNYWLLMILFLIGNLPSNSVYQAPEVLLMEISEPEKTSSIAIVNQIFYSIGYGIMPLVFWVVPDWITFSLIMTAPLIVYLFLYSYMVESPRWLLNRGKTDRCIKEMVKIAKTNRRKIPQGFFKALRSIEPEVEKTYGIMSLFSTPRLAKVTIFLLIQGASHMIIYVLMYLNLNNLKGNPFMNYFWQAVGEIPGQLFGKYLCDRVGRKWSRVFSFIVALIMNIALTYFVTEKDTETIVAVILFTLKMSLGLIQYSMNVGTIEMYPTALRQTGASLNYTVGCLASLACPFFVYLATYYGKGFPYVILAFFSCLGLFASVFLPETLYQTPPETVKEADQLIEKQRVFYFPKRRITLIAEEEIE